MDATTVNHVFEWLIHIVFWATVLSIVSPPIEVFAKFPRFQDYYGVYVAIVQYIALNVRGKIASFYNARQANGGNGGGNGKSDAAASGK